jgi:hypothetical protein
MEASEISFDGDCSCWGGEHKKKKKLYKELYSALLLL